MKKLIKFIRFIGIVFMLASYFVLFLTFLTAYFHPTKSVLVPINTWGEADIELVLLTAAFPFVIFGAKDYIDELKKKAS